MDYRKALPRYNKRNNYVLFLLFKSLQIKTAGEYTYLIFKIINIFSKQVYIFDENITSITERQFYKCKSLKVVVIPNSVTSIEKYAFSDCSSLENFIIPDSVVRIGLGAFFCCISLKEVIIPSSVTYRRFCF